ncbi:MAG: tetratricopeptide repeat protein [Bacteroidales bacterium]|nr:tetratricopeptide repeat protein [Bacteroidales bacterium]
MGALALFTFGLYWPTLNYEFVMYDDPLYILKNPFVCSGWTVESAVWAAVSTEHANWHPLTWWSLQLDVTLWGLNPRGFHLTNILFHAANVALLFVVLRQMTKNVGRSVVVALLFAAHPLHVESVAWVTERKDVLSTFFGLLSLGTYTRYVQSQHRGWLRLTTITLAIGLMAKPMLVTLPCVLLLLDAWPFGRLRSIRDCLPLAWEKLPLFLLSLLDATLTVYAQSTGGAVQHLEQVPLLLRVANAATAYMVYLSMTGWPSGLSILYPLPFERSFWPSAVAGIGLVIITLLTWKLRRTSLYLIIGWLWFLGTLVPVIGLIQVGDQAYADRYTYFPHIGLFLAIVWGMADLSIVMRVPMRIRLVSACLIILVLSLLTRQQMTFWRDSHHLWGRAVAINPANVTAWHQLGADYLERKEWSAAAQCFATALQLNPQALDSQILLKRAQRKQSESTP